MTNKKLLKLACIALLLITLPSVVVFSDYLAPKAVGDRIEVKDKITGMLWEHDLYGVQRRLKFDHLVYPVQVLAHLEEEPVKEILEIISIYLTGYQDIEIDYLEAALNILSAEYGIGTPQVIQDNSKGAGGITILFPDWGAQAEFFVEEENISVRYMQYVYRSKLTPQDEEDLLQREVSVEEISNPEFYRDKSILITGAGGSIAEALIEFLLNLPIGELILLDRDVLRLETLKRKHKKAGIKIVTVEADISDRDAMEDIFESHRPQIIFHTAAFKFSDLAQLPINHPEVLATNVTGSQNLLDFARQFKTECLVVFSTDKAADPSNFYGYTKLWLEQRIQAPDDSSLKTLAVRCANVLGSTGSVIPIVEHRLRAGKPIIVFGSEPSRYFLTAREVASIVLQATSDESIPSGRIMVIKPQGEYKIGSILRRLAELRGIDGVFERGPHRPGDKLQEILVTPEELESAQDKGSYWVLEPSTASTAGSHLALPVELEPGPDHAQWGALAPRAYGNKLLVERVNYLDIYDIGDADDPLWFKGSREIYKCPFLNRANIAQLFGVREEELNLAIELGPGHSEDNLAPIKRARDNPHVQFLLVELIPDTADYWQYTAKKEGCDNIRVVRGDAKEILGENYMAPNTADLILLDFPVLAMFTDDLFYNRVLRPGGLIAVTTESDNIAERFPCRVVNRENAVTFFNKLWHATIFFIKFNESRGRYKVRYCWSQKPPENQGNDSAFGIEMAAPILKLDPVAWDHSGPILIGDDGEPYECPRISRQSMAQLFGVEEEKLSLVIELGPGWEILANGDNYTPIARAREFPNVSFLLVEDDQKGAVAWQKMADFMGCDNIRVICADSGLVIGSNIAPNTVDIILSDMPDYGTILGSQKASELLQLEQYTEVLRPGGILVFYTERDFCKWSFPIVPTVGNSLPNIRFFREMFHWTECMELYRNFPLKAYMHQKPPESCGNDSALGIEMAQPMTGEPLEIEAASIAL